MWSRMYSLPQFLRRALAPQASKRHLRRLVTMSAERALSYRAITNRVMMIRPANFGCNPETVSDNHFQNASTGISPAEAKQKAVGEFDNLVSSLRKAGIEVNVEDDQKDVSVPDAVFPNNWISFDGERRLLVLYPMMAEARRKERRQELIQKWRRKLGAAVLDFSGYEEEGKFLEGTGSMVLDRHNDVLYACCSARTHPDLVRHYSKLLGYKPVIFSASQCVSGQLKPIYHTNVMMCVGEDIAIVCLDCIRDQQERDTVRQSLEASGRKIVCISEDQVNSFLGNILQLYNQSGDKIMVMSTAAYNSLEESQRKAIESSSSIVHSPVETIEALGGGGVRCMIAEVFPPLQ